MKTVEYKGVCYLDEVISKAVTVRLFGKSTWANLGNGLFVRQDGETNEKKTIREIYPLIRTICWDNRVIAKRVKPKEKLLYLAIPFKIQRN